MVDAILDNVDVVVVDVVSGVFAVVDGVVFVDAVDVVFDVLVGVVGFCCC